MKRSGSKPATAKAPAGAALSPGAVALPPTNLPPLFRPMDWLAMGVTFAIIGTFYLLTLAPEVTLEDSGELVTGAFYAGIPHPPGYPVWSIYSWIWTTLLPMGNMAWRVSVGQAFLGCLACGLLALMVSRGSSMFMEGIEALKSMSGRWEKAICFVSAVSAGLLLGLDGFMWKESVVVNRIAVTSVPWFLSVLVCLLRWIYAPQQLRYAYWAAFLFGICITTHQSLIVAAPGLEIALAAGNPRLGRDVFLGNFLVYALYWCFPLFTGGQHVFTNIQAKPGLFILFNLVGVGSLAAGLWLAFVTKAVGTYWKSVLIMAGLWTLGFSFYLYMAVSGMSNPPMEWGYPRTVEGFFHAISRGQYEQPNPTNPFTEPTRYLGQLWMLVSGAADEFTWVYVFIALVPFVFFFKMRRRERAWIIALTAMYVCLGALLMMLLNPTPDKASADLNKVFLCSSHTIVACLIGYGLALTAAFMATHYQKFRLWGLAGGLIVVVLAIVYVWDDTGKHYFGPDGPPIVLSIRELFQLIGRAFAPQQYGLPIYADLILVSLAFLFVVALLVYRQRAPLLLTLGIFGAMPLYSALAHWFPSDQRNHMFGYWFGHDMFSPPFKDQDGKPLYPPMTKDAVLFGGTDPGRFCPTYMIFCESFTPHECQPIEDQKFDRRDVYIITQNAVADPTYLCYLRAQYNRSAQIDPPFFSELIRGAFQNKDGQTNLLAHAVEPLDQFFTHVGAKIEKRRRTYTSWFDEKDFLDLPAFAAKLRPGGQQDPLSKFLYDNLSPPTQQLLGGTGDGQALRSALVADFNRLLESAKSRPLYEPERFKGVVISDYLADFIKENPKGDTGIRLSRLLLEAAYPDSIARSLGGVYPDREIYIPTLDDMQQCYADYTADVSRRMQLGKLKPGENVKSENGKLELQGEFAVMAVNGYIAKVIFDRNPKNEFFVEESLALDWMYPHLTPFGVIMKVNRNVVPAFTEEIVRKDHEFWSQYSHRLIGNWINYDTSVKDIAAFVEQVYLQRNFRGFKGDRKFIHDGDAQKSFSKLRSSIAGLYVWRMGSDCPAELRPKDDAEFQRILREADFACRQAFAFCPYSPEAVFNYVNLLVRMQRLDDAILIVETCQKLDPFNGQVNGVLHDLRKFKERPQTSSPAQRTLEQLEKAVAANPADFQTAFNLASTYLQAQDTNQALRVLNGIMNHPAVDGKAFRVLVEAYASFGNVEGLQRVGQRLRLRLSTNPGDYEASLALAADLQRLQQRSAALQVLDQIIADPAANSNAVIEAAQQFAALGDYSRVEAALQKLTRVSPDLPESWYDLAGIEASLGKSPEALAALRQAFTLSARRLASDPKAHDLKAAAEKEPRFDALRKTAAYQELLKP